MDRMQPHEEPDDFLEDQDFIPIESEWRIQKLRPSLNVAAHSQSPESLPSSTYSSDSVPSREWLTHRLGLSPKRLKIFILSRLLIQRQWLTAPQWEFLEKLIKPCRILVSPESESAKQRCESQRIELELDLVLTTLLQLLPPDTLPTAELISSLENLLCRSSISTVLRKRTLDGLSPTYGKVLPRIVYFKPQRRVPRERKRRRSSEDRGGAHRRVKGQSRVSLPPQEEEYHDPLAEYQIYADSILLLHLYKPALDRGLQHKEEFWTLLKD
jgi:hypothetical protein